MKKSKTEQWIVSIIAILMVFYSFKAISNIVIWALMWR